MSAGGERRTEAFEWLRREITGWVKQWMLPHTPSEPPPHTAPEPFENLEACLSERHLRAVLALAARSGMRVIRLAHHAPPRDQRLAEQSLEAAAGFARGASLPPPRLHLASPQDTPSHGGRVSPVGHLVTVFFELRRAAAASYAVASRVPYATDAREWAVASAVAAIRASRDVLAEAPEGWDVPRDAAATAEAAFWQDYNRLEAHWGSVARLGIPVEVEESGPLGALWPHEDGWYRSPLGEPATMRSVSVASYDAQLLQSIEDGARPVPDVVCWDVSPGVSVEDVLHALDRMDEAVWGERARTPVPVVFARGMDPEDHTRLARRGAIVMDSQREPGALTSADAVRSHLEARPSFADWKNALPQHERRSARGVPAPGPEEVRERGVRPDEEVASQDEVRALLRQLNDGPWWRREY